MPTDMPTRMSICMSTHMPRRMSVCMSACMYYTKMHDSATGVHVDRALWHVVGTKTEEAREAHEPEQQRERHRPPRDRIPRHSDTSNDRMDFGGSHKEVRGRCPRSRAK